MVASLKSKAAVLPTFWPANVEQVSTPVASQPDFTMSLLRVVPVLTAFNVGRKQPN